MRRLLSAGLLVLVALGAAGADASSAGSGLDRALYADRVGGAPYAGTLVSSVIPVPKGCEFLPRSINNHGQIIGNNGCTSRARSGMWEVVVSTSGRVIRSVKLGTGDPAAINDRGQIVGSINVSAAVKRAFLWQAGKMTDLGTPGGQSSRAADINNRGQIVGSITMKNHRTRPFLWEKGKITYLGADGEASAINDRGQVVGGIWAKSGAVRAFLWENGKTTYLGRRDWYPSAINERGQIVGNTRSARGFSLAVIWRNGKLTNLSTGGGNASNAVAIDNQGRVAGSEDDESNIPAGVLWVDGKIGDAYCSPCQPTAMNDHGQIVGYVNEGLGEPTYGEIWISR